MTSRSYNWNHRNKAPLREVARIQDSVGPNGGEIWHLVLVCGHFEARRKPSNRPETAFRRVFKKVATAPRRVRCSSCARARGVAVKTLERKIIAK